MTDNLDETPQDQPVNTDNLRAAVAGQLMRLHDLIRRLEHRRPRGRTPWDDPRRGQGRVLALLKLTPQITQKDLTYLLDMSKQALAELLAKLEKAGLIKRQPSPDDKRTTIVQLTDAGQNADQPVGATDIDQMLGVLDDEELAQFFDYLTRVADALDQAVGDINQQRREMRDEFIRRYAMLDQRPRGRDRRRDEDRARMGLAGRLDRRFGPPEPWAGPDPRFSPDGRPDPRFGPEGRPDPRFGPHGEPGPRPDMGPHDHPGPGPDLGEGSNRRGEFDPEDGFGPRGGFDPRDGFEPRVGFHDCARQHRHRHHGRHHHHRDW